jgi:hypothetical protein
MEPIITPMGMNSVTSPPTKPRLDAGTNSWTKGQVDAVEPADTKSHEETEGGQEDPAMVRGRRAAAGMATRSDPGSRSSSDEYCNWPAAAVVNNSILATAGYLSAEILFDQRQTSYQFLQSCRLKSRRRPR